MRWTEQQLTQHLRKYGLPGAENTADVSAPPFAVPPDIVLDLPAPISVNRLWRAAKNGVIKSDRYKFWTRKADHLLIELGQLKGVRSIPGRFTALIVCKRSLVDLDNNAKCVLDFLQSRNFIVDDKLCEELTLRWGDAPTGCRVTVKPCLTMKAILQNVSELAE